MGVTVVIGACQGCGACLLTCPEHALRAAPARPWVDTGRCTGCGECAEVCPVDVITVHPAAAHGAPHRAVPWAGAGGGGHR